MARYVVTRPSFINSVYYEAGAIVDLTNVVSTDPKPHEMGMDDNIRLLAADPAVVEHADLMVE